MESYQNPMAKDSAQSAERKSELPLFRMIYSSHIRYSVLNNHQVFLKLAKQVSKNSQRYGITGVLCFGNGYFMQYVEGTEEALTNLKNRLLNDTRHYGFCLSEFSEIENRFFDNSKMHFAVLEKSFHPADSKLKEYMPFNPISWTLNKQLELVEDVKQYGLLEKDFKLSAFQTFVSQVRLFFLLIKENINKEQMFLVYAILMFAGLVVLLCLLAFGVLVI